MRVREKVLDWLDRVLVANVFFVLLSFVWFAIALLGRLWGVPLGFDWWYRLWQPLFMPAIGVLMAGVLISALGKYIFKFITKLSN